MRLVAGAPVAGDGGDGDPTGAARGRRRRGSPRRSRGCARPTGSRDVDARRRAARDAAAVPARGRALAAPARELGLGACLADDMGLGKTIQVLALLLVSRARAPQRCRTLLVVPASLLANWTRELARFAPGLRVRRRASVRDVARASSRTRPNARRRRPRDHDLRHAAARAVADADARGTSSSLDEAQAIKNPGAKQTRAVKALDARARDRAHRHAGREPARRSVVDLRLREPGPARHREAVRALHQAPGRRRRTATGRCASWCGRTCCAG